VERVGVYDDFFELGGHSLLATQVMSRLRKAFDVQLGLRSVYEDTTVEAIARQIEVGIFRETASEELEALLQRLE
jgi:hypothetical protein